MLQCYFILIPFFLVMSHVWISHVPHTWKGDVTHVNESCVHTYLWNLTSYSYLSMQSYFIFIPIYHVGLQLLFHMTRSYLSINHATPANKCVCVCVCACVCVCVCVCAVSVSVSVSVCVCVCVPVSVSMLYGTDTGVHTVWHRCTTQLYLCVPLFLSLCVFVP